VTTTDPGWPSAERTCIHKEKKIKKNARKKKNKTQKEDQSNSAATPRFF
jgi:hypothetical protein